MQGDLIFKLWEPSVNRKDSWALTLVGPPSNNPKIAPLAVLHLDNRLYIYFFAQACSATRPRVAVLLREQLFNLWVPNKVHKDY